MFFTLPDSYGYLIILGIILYFLIGFFPGFYLAYLFIRKRVKKPKLYFILFYFIIGIVGGLLDLFYISSALDSLSLRYRYLSVFLNPFIIIILEIIVITIHFFYSRNKKKK